MPPSGNGEGRIKPHRIIAIEARETTRAYGELIPKAIEKPGERIEIEPLKPMPIRFVGDASAEPVDVYAEPSAASFPGAGEFSSVRILKSLWHDVGTAFDFAPVSSEAQPAEPLSPGEQLAKGALVLAGVLGLASFSGGAPSPIAVKVEHNVRRELVRASRTGVYRNSPTSPTQNVRTVRLNFDATTGDLLPSDKPMAPGQSVITVPVSADFDTGQIFLDARTLQGARESSGDASLPPQARAVFSALAGMHGQRLVAEQASAAPRLEAPQAEVEVLPQVAPAEIAQMRREIAGTARSAAMGTFMIRDPLHMELEMASFVVGLVRMDGDGQIVGLEFGRNALTTARGTTYKSGLPGQGTAVPVVADHRGNIYYFDASGLNARQRAVFDAFTAEPGNRTAVERASARNPYLVDVTIGRGAGTALTSVGPNLRREASGLSSGRLALVRDERNDFHFVPADAIPDVVEKLAVVDFRLKPRSDVANREGRPGELSYRIQEGVLPVEVAEGLNFLAGRASTPINDLLRESALAKRTSAFSRAAYASGLTPPKKDR